MHVHTHALCIIYGAVAHINVGTYICMYTYVCVHVNIYIYIYADMHSWTEVTCACVC